MKLSEETSEKTIFSTRLTKDFTTLPNGLLRNKALSFKARGLLVMILSNREDWKVTNDWLEKQGTEGREAIKSGMKELESAGYCAFEKLRNKKGVIVGVRWTFYADPLPEPERTNRSNWRTPENECEQPCYGKPYDGTEETHGTANRATASRTLSERLSEKKDYEIPEELKGDDFALAWDEWKQHRKEKGITITPLARKKQLKQLAQWGKVRAIAAIENSIIKSYRGIFEENSNQNHNGKTGSNGHKPKAEDASKYYASPETRRAIQEHEEETLGALRKRVSENLGRK